jgi:CubicO group peptidase (beta-lactamase class C family)
MGVVFKARHRTLGRLGALKILPPSFSRDANAVSRFRREVEAAGRVKHANLVAAFDADEDRGVHFLVMDFVDGRDLDRVVRLRGPLLVPEAVDYLTQAARGLEAAHAQGIIHRDIKPGNLMLERTGTVRVLDLGLARIVDVNNPFNKTATARLTQSGMYMGTIDYMAPEQAEDSHRVDHRADIYSLGCTLFYFLTGRAPFAGDTVLKRLMSHMERPAPTLRSHRSDVPRALDAAYQQMMAKKPMARPASMTEVIALLQASMLAGDAVTVPLAARPKSRPEPMVFNETPRARAGSARTEIDPAVMAGSDELQCPAADHELNLEDLAIDVRWETAAIRVNVADSLESGHAENQRPWGWTRLTGGPRSIVAVGCTLAAVGLLAALLGVFMLTRRPVAGTNEASSQPTIDADEGEPDQSVANPPRPRPEPKTPPISLVPASRDSLSTVPTPPMPTPAAPRLAAPEPASATPASTKAIVFTPAPEKPRWVIIGKQHSYYARNISQEAFKTLGDVAKKGGELKSIAFAPGDGWAILYGKNGYKAKNVPDDAQKMLRDLALRGEELKSIAFTPEGGWTILFGWNGNFSQGIPDKAFETLQSLTKRGVELKSVSYGPGGGWTILFDRNGWFVGNVPDDAFNTLEGIAKRGEELKSVALGPKGCWAILYGRNGFNAGGIPVEAQERLNIMSSDGPLKCLTFVARPDVPLRIDDPETRNRVLARMAYYDVPGLGIALVNNFQVEWARGYGILRAGGSEPVTPETIFPAASLSKPVTALAALCLVQQRKLMLDQPLNEKLTSWKVADNEFTRRNKPTLREVLSHSAGFPAHAFAGYPAGSRLPTLIEILDGKRPANSPSVRVQFVPGSKFQYSGGGYLVLQQIIVDVTRKPFSDALRALVFAPLEMRHSGFQQPPPSEFEAQAATGHERGTALPGKWRIHPELAAAGLWTTPTDLARFVIAIQRAKRGDSGAILEPNMAAEMLRKQSGEFGLGVVVSGSGSSAYFEHDGAFAGFRCRVIGFVETGQGAVFLTNGDRGLALINELVESLRADYGWPG